MLEYMTVTQAAVTWGISTRSVRPLCSEDKIKGVIREGRHYTTPVDTKRPPYGRRLRGKMIAK